MKKELMKALGRKYILDGNNIIDSSVQGFDAHRNVAQVREFKGMLHVNRYNGYWYKSGEEKDFATVQEAVNYILRK